MRTIKSLVFENSSSDTESEVESKGIKPEPDPLECDNRFDNTVLRLPKSEEKLLACRVCLAVDVTLHSLYECKMDEILGEFTGIPVSQDDGLPQHVCYLCRALLQKSAAFRDKCRGTYHYLKNVYVWTSQLTTQDIRMVDKKHFTLPLMQTPTITLDYCAETGVTIERDLPDAPFMNEPESSNKFEIHDQLPHTSKANNAPIVGSNIINTNKHTRIGNKGKMPSQNFLTEFNIDIVALSVEELMQEASVNKNSKTLHSVNRGSRECEICWESFATEYDRINHVSNKHDALRFKCRFCGYLSKTMIHAETHYNTHKVEGLPYYCEHCPKTFSSFTVFTSHVRQYHAMQRCGDSGEGFTRSNALEDHRVRHAPSNVEAKNMHPKFIDYYQCDLCKKKYILKCALEKHIENHNKKKTKLPRKKKAVKRKIICYGCGLCPERFPSRHRFDLHKVQVHNIGTKYQCDTCDKVFWLRHNFLVHLKTHNGLRPHKCSICQKSYRNKVNLEEHMNTAHTGAKPYQCPYCPKMFNRYAQRYKHKMRVHMKKPVEKHSSTRRMQSTDSE